MKEQIEEIMNNFDFIRVHRVMEELDWEWCWTDGVPSVEELRYKARQQLNEVTTKYKSDASVSSGGFKASIKRNYKNELYLELEFVIEDWNTEYYFDD